MLRHKAMIQCARVAFGFVGVFDPDEAERIVEVEPTAPGKKTRQTTLAAITEQAEPESEEREPDSDDEVIEGEAETVE
jgi:hypothetical protein